MLDVDYAPGVFAGIITLVFVLPGLYGLLFVDSYWEGHKNNAAEDDMDAFN